ncbi:MAG TPA: RluA family pseudouridine synthase [bacterium]|nr:RluA family pseudouridine synthase [bacterium]
MGAGDSAVHTLVVSPENAGERVDRFVSERNPGLSRAQAQRLILEEKVRIDGRSVKPNSRIKAGQVIVIVIPAPVPSSALPEPIPLNILYEDTDLLVINKPAGLVVHPAAGNRSGTLVNALLHHCRDLSGIGGVERPGIVHRLDKGTSGLLIVAKNDAAHKHFTQEIKNRKVKRQYLALVEGGLKQLSGRVEAPIGRHATQRIKMAVVARGGRPAVTHYEVLKVLKGYSLLRLTLETGRTHQIRVHMAHLGHPVAGDPTYGKRRHGPRRGVEGTVVELDRPFLHAYRLEFRHPRSGELLVFEIPLPPDLERVCNVLEAAVNTG